MSFAAILLHLDSEGFGNELHGLFASDMKFAVELLLLDFSACGSGSFLLDDCDDIHSVDTNLRIVCLSREVGVFFDTETEVSGCVELACVKDVLDRVGLQCNSKEVDCLLTAEGNLTADWLSAADTKCRKGVLSVGADWLGAVGSFVGNVPILL